MEDEETHVCTCGGACKEKFVKVENKNKETKDQVFLILTNLFLNTVV